MNDRVVIYRVTFHATDDQYAKVMEALEQIGVTVLIDGPIGNPKVRNDDEEG